MFNSFLSNVTTQATKAAQALATEYKQATAIAQAPGAASPTSATDAVAIPVAAPPSGASSSSSSSSTSSSSSPSSSTASSTSATTAVSSSTPAAAGKDPSSKKLTRNASEISREELVTLVQKLQKRLAKVEGGSETLKHRLEEAEAEVDALRRERDERVDQIQVHPMSPHSGPLSAPHPDTNGHAQRVSADHGGGKCLNCVVQEAAVEELQSKVSRLEQEGEARHGGGDGVIDQLRAELQQRESDLRALRQRLAEADEHKESKGGTAVVGDADDWMARYHLSEQQRAETEARLAAEKKESAALVQQQQQLAKTLQDEARANNDSAVKAREEQQRAQQQLQQRDADIASLLAQHEAKTTKAAQDLDELKRLHAQQLRAATTAASSSSDAVAEELAKVKQQLRTRDEQAQREADTASQQKKAAADALQMLRDELRREKERSNEKAAKAALEVSEWKRNHQDAVQSSASAAGRGAPAPSDGESATWKLQVDEWKQRAAAEEEKVRDREERLSEQQRDADARLAAAQRQHEEGLSAVQRELKEWRTKHEETSQGKDAFDFVRAKLERELKALTEREAELKEKLKAAEVDKKGQQQTKDELERLKKEKADVQKAAADKEAAWTAARKALEEKSSASEVQLQALRKADEQQRAAREEAKVEAAKLNEKLVRVQKLLEDSLHKSTVLEQKNAARKQKLKQLKDELDARAKERQELDARIAAADQKTLAAEQKAARLTQLQSTLDNTVKDADSRAREVKEMRERMEALITEKEQLTAAHVRALADKDRVIANTRAEWEDSRERLRKGEDAHEEMIEVRRELASRKDEVQELLNELEHERMMKERERQAQEQVAEMEREERDREREERDRQHARLERESTEKVAALDAEIKSLNVKLRAGAKKFKATVAELEALKAKADSAEAERTALSGRLQEVEVQRVQERNELSEKAISIENKHAERYERLLKEHRTYKEHHDRTVDELSSSLKEAQDRVAKLEEEVASGQPQERRIFELAELQARREDAVRKAETEAATLKQANAEYKRRMKLLKEELSFAQAQLAAVKGSEGRSSVNVDYLKSVLVRFLAFDPAHPQRRALIPVLATILHFTPEELRSVETVKPNSASWLSMLGMQAGAETSVGSPAPVSQTPPRTPSSHRRTGSSAAVSTPRAPSAATAPLAPGAGAGASGGGTVMPTSMPPGGMNGRVVSAPVHTSPTQPTTPPSATSPS